jgi:hypothetical protein
MLAQSPHCVSLRSRLNTGVLERTLDQLRLNAVAASFDNNEVRVLQGGIISPDRIQTGGSRNT